MKIRLLHELRLSQDESVEYVNLYLITMFAALFYSLHAIVIALYAYHPALIANQAISVCVCVAAFYLNQNRQSRYAAILMICIICASINVWAFMFDMGIESRWYSILALTPLYFFSIGSKLDKILLTTLIVASFLSSTIIAYWHEPIVMTRYPEMYSTLNSLAIFCSIAIELILYKYVNDQRDSELLRMETILDNIECGIVIVDAETHKILDVNHVAERMFGAGKETIIGEVCHNLICFADTGECPVTDKLQEVRRSERALLKADGQRIPIIKSVAMIRYNDRPALLESFTDITDLKEAEEKLRLLEITEQANLAKSTFLSRMSHEMRTPMNAIIGMTKIAEGTEDVSRLKYCLSTIDVTSSHLLGIINDILDMSKIESGKFDLDSAPLYIDNILSKVSSIMAEQAEKKNVRLNICIGVDTSSCYIGDELRLTQVITNLLSNAVKFTPGGGNVRLTVERSGREADFSILRFAVTDTGIGMTEEQAARLFNAFEQANGNITREYGGTGLGLAISKSIVEKMEGSIWVESKYGEGSTFSFEVRLKNAPENLVIRDDIGYKPAGLAAAPKAAVEIPDFSGVTILLAEDVAINREILVTLLEDTNIAVDTAENGLIAVKKFEENHERYSAIVMDIHMPLMNGYEATKAIRAMSMDRARSVPIIALTADAFKEDVDRCLAAGMNNHLKKPIELDKVIDVLSYYCLAGQSGTKMAGA